MATATTRAPPARAQAMSQRCVTDDDDVGGGHVLAEVTLEALAHDRHQAVPIAVVGSVAAQLEGHVLIEAGRRRA